MERELTRLELQLMNILWDKEKAFVNDIIDVMPEPKPAYSTVSTIMRILVTKGFVNYEAFGKSHRYYPLISKPEYTRMFLRNTKNNLFDGSFKSMVSFFAREEKLSKQDMDELINIVNEK